MDPRRTAIARRRVELAAAGRQVHEEGWDQPSLCGGWTCREVLGHLVTFYDTSAPRVTVTVVRRGGVAGAFDDLARRHARRPVAELLDTIEANAFTAYEPGWLGPGAPLTEIVVHGQDVGRPLGLALRPDPDDVRAALDFVTSRRASPLFLPAGRLRGLRLEADDLGWRSGRRGEPVRGPGLELLLAVLGRPVADGALDGPTIPA